MGGVEKPLSAPKPSSEELLPAKNLASGAIGRASLCGGEPQEIREMHLGP